MAGATYGEHRLRVRYAPTPVRRDWERDREDGACSRL